MRMKKSTAITIISPGDAAAEVSKFVPRQAFEQFSFWEQLKEREQNKLVEEGQHIGTALVAHGASGLAIGQHLISVKALLEPYSGAFSRVCQGFRFTPRMAYRYIKAYENASQRLPEAALHAVMARGMNIFGHTDSKPLGKYTDAFRMLGAPTSTTPDKVNEWAMQLEQTRKEIVKAKNKRRAEGHAKPEEVIEEIKRTPEFRLRRNFRNIKNDLRRIPSKKRRDWLESLFGMVMTQAGITSKTSFSPEAIPEDFLQGRGRPSIGETEAA